VQSLLGRERRGTTYIDSYTSAEARASIEPVIVLELVHLHALAVVGRRADLCHPRGADLPRLERGGRLSQRREECGCSERGRGSVRRNVGRLQADGMHLRGGNSVAGLVGGRAVGSQMRAAVGFRRSVLAATRNSDCKVPLRTMLTTRRGSASRQSEGAG
jgi:hypothetical protein